MVLDLFSEFSPARISIEIFRTIELTELATMVQTYHGFGNRTQALGFVFLPLLHLTKELALNVYGLAGKVIASDTKDLGLES